MMDDLISRKDLLNNMRAGCMPLDEPEISGLVGDRETIRSYIVNTPSVPAVPLDKLCEWLASIPMMNCRVCKETVGFCDGKTNNICGSAEQWKAILTKWMEGLDDAEIMVQKT